MTATVISLAEVKKGRAPVQGAPASPEPEFSVTYGLLLRISVKLGIPLEPEQRAYLRKYGHLLP